MPKAVRAVRKALTSKLGFSEDRKLDHPVFERLHEGQVVGVTHISHRSGGDDISEGELGAMARQLEVSGPEFRGAIDCSISGDEFLRLLLAP